MALTYRFTASGRLKQQADERAAWKALRAAAQGTPAAATILAIGTWNVAGDCTNVNNAHPNYQDWIEAQSARLLGLKP